MKRYTMQILTSVTIPTGTSNIAAAAYTGCPITSIVIPASVTSIGMNAFRSSPNLASVTIIGATMTSIGSLLYHEHYHNIIKP